jgi:hypothetical protein
MVNIPENILNYCKLIVDPLSEINNCIRPYKHDLPDEYKPILLKNKLKIKLNKGITNIYLMPDNCVTSNISANLGHEKLYYSIGYKEYNGYYEYIYMNQLNVENAEKYRNVITTVEVPEGVKTSSTICELEHKPIISLLNIKSDIRNNDIDKRLKLKSRVYNNTQNKTSIRYLSKTNSIDIIGLVDQQANFIPDDVKNNFIKNYIKHINDSNNEFFDDFDDSIHTINSMFTVLQFCEEQKYKSLVKNNVLHIMFNTNEEKFIEIYQVYEIYKYLGNDELGLETIKNTKWVNILENFIELLHILYFKSIEEIISIMYYPNGITMLPLSYEDKEKLKKLKNSNYFQTIWSIIVQLWQQTAVN